VVIELLDADGFMIGHAFLVAVVDAFEAVEADAAVEVALIVDSDELEGFVVLVAAVDAQVHG